MPPGRRSGSPDAYAELDADRDRCSRVPCFRIRWATTGKAEFGFAKAIVTSSTAIIIGLLVFDRWLWRYIPFRWFIGRPVLHGTWKIELKTSHVPRADETIEAYLVIRQTYSTIRADGLFDRSNSECLSADLTVQNGRCTLNYIFRTEAHTRHREGNPPSRGAASLRVGRQPGVSLGGRLLDGAWHKRRDQVGRAHDEDLRHVRLGEECGVLTWLGRRFKPILAC